MTDAPPSPRSDYDRAITLRPTTTPGRYAAEFSDQWLIGSAVNGGLVMALATTALATRIGEVGGHLDPFAFSGYFLTASQPGDVVVDTEVLRSGRTLTTGQVSVSQPGRGGIPVERMRALVSLGDLAASAVPIRAQAPPPMPPPEDCVSSSEQRPPGLKASALLDRLDLRLDPATAGWAVGRPSGRGEIRAWLRLADGREPDPTLLLLALDGLPPVAFDLGIQGWAPTLEFTAHVRARPAPGWLQLRVTSENLSGGLMEEDAVVWDSTGRLVAQSRQLCGVRVPDGYTVPG